MGCRTGFYLLLIGDYESCDILPLMKEMFAFIASYDQEVPSLCKRLRKLSGYESADGQICCTKIPDSGFE